MTDLLSSFKNGNLVLLGKRGSGKTFLGTKAAAFRPNGLVIDTLGDCPLGRRVGYWEIHNGGGWKRFDVLAEADAAGVSPSDMAPVLFTAVHRLARAGVLERPFCLFVDEADSYGSAAYNSPALSDLARYGRHWGVTFIITARRYAEIPKDWTSGADLILLGPSLDPNDSDAAKRILGRNLWRNWTSVQSREFLGISLDGAGIYGYNSIDNSVHARGVSG